MLKREVLVELPSSSKQFSGYVDFVFGLVALDRDLSSPPGSPSRGDSYIIASSPTGDWSGFANYVTWWNSAWYLFKPWKGYTCWVEDESVLVVWNGSSWSTVTMT